MPRLPTAIPFSATEDAELLRRKRDGETFYAIAEHLAPRSFQVLRARYATLMTRMPSPPKAPWIDRTCLGHNCGKKFKTRSRFIRLCPTCSAYAAGVSPLMCSASTPGRLGECGGRVSAQGGSGV